MLPYSIPKEGSAYVLQDSPVWSEVRQKVFASGASAETGLAKNGTVLRFEVEQGDTLQWSDPFPEDATAFFKTGPGTLELSSDNASFKGSAAVPPALRS